jgi:hypothetical protein
MEATPPGTLDRHGFDQCPHGQTFGKLARPNPGSDPANEHIRQEARVLAELKLLCGRQ